MAWCDASFPYFTLTVAGDKSEVEMASQPSQTTNISQLQSKLIEMLWSWWSLGSLPTQAICDSMILWSATLKCKFHKSEFPMVSYVLFVAISNHLWILRIAWACFNLWEMCISCLCNSINALVLGQRERTDSPQIPPSWGSSHNMQVWKGNICSCEEEVWVRISPAETLLTTHTDKHIPKK